MVMAVINSFFIARSSKMTCGSSRCETITGLLRVKIVFDIHRIWRRYWYNFLDFFRLADVYLCSIVIVLDNLALSALSLNW